MSNMDKIDIVMTWVDGSDPQWTASKAEWENKIKGIDESSNGITRYRDWDNLQYIFRGIEKFMPWVNNVYFVTDEQLPEWLNKEAPNLKLIDHKDFIPHEYLPTFSANPIELNFHRIKGLNEKFIVFNDDFITTAPTKPEDFFKGGLP